MASYLLAGKHQAWVIQGWPAMCSAVAVPGGELAARASAVPVPSAMLERLQPDGVMKTMRLYAQP